VLWRYRYKEEDADRNSEAEAESFGGGGERLAFPDPKQRDDKAIDGNEGRGFRADRDRQGG